MVVDLDVVREVRELLSNASCVLFDFDGPICRLFPNDSSRFVAEELRERLQNFLRERDTGLGLEDVLNPDEREDKDPHVVLRAVHRARRLGDLGDLVEVLEEQVTARELKAVRKAVPTDDSAEFIKTLAGWGLRLAVVTNNSPRAAARYLEDNGLGGYFESVQGRTSDPDLMKPHPDVIGRALGSLLLPERGAVMIGDAGTDVQAADRAGVRFVGYARNARKEAGLRDAGATLVLSSYAPLLT